MCLLGTQVIEICAGCSCMITSQITPSGNAVRQCPGDTTRNHIHTCLHSRLAYAASYPFHMGICQLPVFIYQTGAIDERPGKPLGELMRCMYTLSFPHCSITTTLASRAGITGRPEEGTRWISSKVPLLRPRIVAVIFPAAFRSSRVPSPAHAFLRACTCSIIDFWSWLERWYVKPP
jgi:hypothetical protein